MDDKTIITLRNIFLALSMKYGAVKVKASWKPSAEGNITVNLESEYTNPDTQFHIDECASLKEARRVWQKTGRFKDLPIDELIASRSTQDWKNSTVTFTFTFVNHHQVNHEIIVDGGEIDWDSIEDKNANDFYAIATSPKVLENH